MNNTQPQTHSNRFSGAGLSSICTIEQAVAAYKSRDWPIIPVYGLTQCNNQFLCRCGDIKRLASGEPLCRTPGKHPMIVGWETTTRFDEALLQKFLPLKCNLGLVCGRASGVLVLDIDQPEKQLLWLKKEFGLTRDYTLVARTGRGVHLFFQYPDVPAGFSLASQLGDHIEVKRDGQFVVVAPSLHPSGHRYRFINDRDISPVPPKLLKAIFKKQRATPRRQLTPQQQRQAKPPTARDTNVVARQLKELLAPYWTDGSRHKLSLGLAGLLRRSGLSREDSQRIYDECVALLPNNNLPDRYKTLETTYDKPLEDVAAASLLLEAGVPESIIRAIRSLVDYKDDNRTVIEYSPLPQRLKRIVKQLEHVIVTKAVPLYRMGSSLVVVKKCSAAKNSELEYQIHPPSPEAVLLLLADHVRFTDPETLEERPIPSSVLSLLLDNPETTLLPFAGFAYTPYIDTNGEIRAPLGHDSETGLFFTDNWTDILEQIPERPTIENAKRALDGVLTLVHSLPFKFANTLSESVGLACLYTAAVLPSLDQTPLFMISATRQGAGKTLLADLVAVIATGRVVSRITPREAHEEIDKRIESAIHQGWPVISIDNYNKRLSSDQLASFLTSPRLSFRLLGESRIVEHPNRFLYLINGNNVQVGGDLARRTLEVHLDSRTQTGDPDMAPGNPPDVIALTQKVRKELISCFLIIAKAYLIAGRPISRQVPTLTIFRKWGQIVRESLIWLGYPDPWTARVKLEDDPDYERKIAILELLDRQFAAQHFTVRTVLQLLQTSRHNSPEAQELETLLSASVAPKALAHDSLGYLFRRMAEQEYGGRRLVPAGKTMGYTRYRIERSEQAWRQEEE